MPEQASTPAAIPEPSPVTGPIRAKERIEVIDILRGWAIFGIVLINWTGYTLSSLDYATGLLISFFVEGKFYTLFSFLFGLGLVIQMGRAEARGARFVPIYLRRLSILLLIGLGHSFLLWRGDILHHYAVLGFLLLLFRTRSPKTLLVAALICLAITIVFDPGDGQSGMASLLRRADPETAQAMSREAAERELNNVVRWQQYGRAVSQGTYAEMVANRVEIFVRTNSAVDWNPYLARYLPIFSMFLLGLYAGRRGIFQNLPAHLPFIRKLMWWGLGLGLVANLVHVGGHELSRLNVYSLSYSVIEGTLYVGAPALCFFYASAIILLLQREAWQKRLGPLAYVGRMALSNYLLQTLIFTTIFYSYGLGLQIQSALLLPLTIVVFCMQIVLSVWWLGRFQFGPMEWLWRSLTYGKFQTMRVRQVVAATDRARGLRL